MAIKTLLFLQINMNWYWPEPNSSIFFFPFPQLIVKSLNSRKYWTFYWAQRSRLPMFVSCKTAKSNISCFLRVSGRWLVSKMMPAKYMLEVSQVIINSEPLIIGLVGNKQVCFLVTYNEQKRKIATFSFFPSWTKELMTVSLHTKGLFLSIPPFFEHIFFSQS